MTVLNMTAQGGDIMYSESKAAQMAAYLLHKCSGQTEYIKILKLMYLADRESLDQSGSSISDDRMVSMPHGPVLSKTYDMMKTPGHTHWETLISDESRYQIALRRPVDPDNDDDFLELSAYDMRIMDKVVDSFGHMGWRELVEYTHDRCQEWNDPNGSSHPIKLMNVFRALGRSPEEAQDLERDAIERRQYQEEMAAYL